MGWEMGAEMTRISKAFGRAVAGPVLALALAIAVAPVPEALAQSSSIRIIVNDQAITSMDIANRARLLQVANRMAPGAATKAAEEELIEERLRMGEAARRGIKVPDAAVDAAIADIAARSKLTPAQFGQALGQAGVPVRTLKDRIRVQMAWGRVVRARVQQSVANAQNDLIAQMRRQETGSTATAEDLVLQRVVFTLPANASADAVSRRMREAEQLRNRFDGCDSGLALAKSIREVAVLNVGRKLASELPPGFREAAKSTKEGGLTKPERTDQGVEMFAICERITVTGEGAIGSNMDAEAMSAEGEKVSQTLTQELRQKANIVYR